MKVTRAWYSFLSAALVVFLALPPQAQPAAPAPSKSNASTDAIGKESPWPLTIKDGDTTITVYQPQLDSWDGHMLQARVAVQAAVGEKNPQSSYGILELKARTLTDKGTRVVTIDNAQILKAEFPSATPERARQWTDAIARDFKGKSRAIALDRLEAALGVAKASAVTQAKPLRNDPPEVIFSAVPAMLLYIDGEPSYQPMADTPFERIINTRALLLRDSKGMHYLKIFDGWMSAPKLNAEWKVDSRPNKDLDKAFKAASEARLVDPLTGQTTPEDEAPSLKKIQPAIFIATRPTELIVTDGQPQYAPIKGTQLLYVTNTTGNIFKTTTDNRVYVLASGRWFSAATEVGPWKFVPANELPRDFTNIPDDSSKENIKASVAGTSQAKEAAIAASVPQTASVKISGTRLTTPQFDGEPTFKPIEGTENLEYVVNSQTPIIRAYHNTCYALENGVWFVATSVKGPWSVATAVPPMVYSIPPSSPLYYVTYVKIYAVDGDTVYVGYTPGYQGTYVDPVTEVVVYGTGYVYAPYVTTVWYGPPVTYGCGASVVYTPWTGWAVAFGIGWAWGAATVAWGWGWGPYPWWGTWGWGWAWGPPYYPWYPAWGGAAWGPNGVVAWGPGGWAGYTGNMYQNWGNRATVSHAAGGYNAWTGNRWAAEAGISYNSRTGVASAGQRGAVQNVYTGNYATGARGGAVGQQGGAVIGRHGEVGNIYTGNSVSGSQGAFRNPNTGEWTSFGSVSGDRGTVARVGDDVYAGNDGNIYRRTDDGWQQHTGDGWQDVGGGGNQAGQLPSSGERPSGGDRPGGGGGNQASQLPSMGSGSGNRVQTNDYSSQQLNRDYEARQYGSQRSNQLRSSSYGMNRSYGGGARMGGGRRR